MEYNYASSSSPHATEDSSEPLPVDSTEPFSASPIEEALASNFLTQLHRYFHANLEAKGSAISACASELLVASEQQDMAPAPVLPMKPKPTRILSAGAFLDGLKADLMRVPSAPSMLPPSSPPKIDDVPREFTLRKTSSLDSAVSHSETADLAAGRRRRYQRKRRLLTSGKVSLQQGNNNNNDDKAVMGH
jgi:hypothetical protein